MSLEPKHHFKGNKRDNISKEHSLDINILNQIEQVGRDYSYTRKQVHKNNNVKGRQDTLVKFTFYGKYIFYIILGVLMPIIWTSASPLISQWFNSLSTTDKVNAIPKTTILREANFQGVNFSQANFTEFNLERANFHKTNLYKATLTGANLQEANLQQVRLEGAYYSSSTKWPDDKYPNQLKNQTIYLIAPNSDLVKTNLAEANLQGANLEGANLAESNLRNANLQGANLRNANLQGANLRNANLQGANLQGVKIDYATLESANLKDAKF